MHTSLHQYIKVYDNTCRYISQFLLHTSVGSSCVGRSTRNTT